MHRLDRRLCRVIKTRIKLSNRKWSDCEAMRLLLPSTCALSSVSSSYSSSALTGNRNEHEAEQRNEEIVISGVSGRFPQSDNMDEFKANLYNKMDMLREQTRFKCQKIPPRYGLLKSLDKFDAGFFGVVPKLAHYMDPQQRILLEVGFEAIVDSGLNPEVLKGSSTGVYVGASGTESMEYWLLGSHTNAMEGYATSVSSVPLANRLSFSFDLKGPSLAVNTGCSASFIALEAAVQSIRSGVCEAAIVAGTTIHVSPFTSVDFWELGALAPDGKCKAFDASGDGFARSEAVAAILIQKRKNAKRVYATVRDIQSNADGYKLNGFTFPSGASQERLIRKMYTKAGIDPGQIKYIEAHGTGTPAGDPEELSAISNVFSKAESRKEPLLVGSVKSNMGHGESAAGVCSIAKMLISFQEGKLPPNLHFNKPRDNVQHIFDGSIQVVTETTPWTGGLIGINSFGIGGTNAHLILESEQLSESTSLKTSEDLPLILPFSGRTEEAVRESLEKAVELGKNPEFVGLVHNVFKSNVSGHYVRGHAIASAGQPPSISVDTLPFEGGQRPVAFVFPGMGSQWTEMGKELQRIDSFRDSLRLSKETLKNSGMDLDKLLQPNNSAIFTNIRDAVVSITAVQIALYDTMRSLGVKPDVFLGHSFGEIICGYADGSFTAEEALLVAEARGRAFQEAIQSSPVPGGMAAVGLSWEEIVSKCPPDVYPACKNSTSNVTISGSSSAVKDFVQNLKNEGIFAQEVNSCGCAAHSPYVFSAGESLEKYILEFYPKEREQVRSERWISSSVPESEWGNPLGKNNSAAYHANNVTSPVLFHEAVQHIPKNAAVIEIAPKGLFQGILKGSLDKDNFLIAPMTSAKESDKINYFLTSLGKIYNAGVNVDLSPLYPPISFPVSVGTPTLSNLVKWNHEDSWTVPVVPNYVKMAAEGVTFKIDLSSQEGRFLEGHKLDSRTVYPATGYLYLAWQGLATNLGVDINDLAVAFENVSFERATFLQEDKSTEFKFTWSSATGSFELKEEGAVVVRGNIKEVENPKSRFSGEVYIPEKSREVSGGSTSISRLKKEDVYKELRLRGYNYSGEFQGIQQADINGAWAEVGWNGNWISFLDTVLQTTVLSYRNSRNTAVPVRLQQVLINPKELHAFLDKQANNRLENEESTSDMDPVPVPVKIDSDLQTITCPGVEMGGLTASVIPRKRQDKSLSVEEYKFTPYFDNVKNSLDVGIAGIIDLVLENLQSRKIKIVDIFHKREDSMTELIDKAMSSKPSHQAEIKILSTRSEIEKLDEKVRAMGNVQVEENFSMDPAADLIFLDELTISSSSLGNLSGNPYLVLHSKTDVGTRVESRDFVKIAQIIANDSVFHLFKKRIVPDLKQVKVVKIDGQNFDWLPQLQSLIAEESSANGESSSRIYLTSQNDPASGVIGLVKCLRREGGAGERIRCIFDPEGQLPLNFEKPEHSLMEILEKDLVVNVVKGGQLGSYRHLPISSQDQSVTSLKQVEHAYINTLTTGDLTSLRWIESPLKYCDPLSTQEGTLCTVNYASMNFRDVMLASGRLPIDASTSSSDCVLGFEFSGIDPKGNRIMGMLPSKALATSVLANPALSWKIPDHWSLEEAATVPIVYATAYYAMFYRGQLRPGQSILIHSGTGGVGQAAIHLALNTNCEIFTTVGNEEKRRFVKILFPSLKDENIFSSRDCDFEKLILKRTAGKGINAVLNSLSDDKLQASVRCLAKHGKFLEIGAFDAAQNTGLGMSCFLKNIDFQGIFLNQIFEEEEHRNFIKNAVEQGMATGVVKPLPRTVFDSERIEEAFRFMAGGKHMGKVLIKVQEEQKDAMKNNHQNSTPVKVPAVPRTYFHPEKSYIIVGGLGGLGLEVAGWMVDRGAKNLILTSRSGVTTGYQQLCLDNWAAKGVTVQTPKVDLSKYETALDFIRNVSQIQTIGGVFNSGLVLKDALIENQTKEMFEAVAAPKIQTTQNLDKLSREFCPDLDYFVVFSSGACGRGNPGQSNYGLSNSVMERICEQRKEDGLHGLAIQWGVIGEVGFVAEKFGSNSGSGKKKSGIMPTEEIFEGTVPQTIQSCLEVIDLAMNKDCPVFSSMVLGDKSTGKTKKGGILATFSNAFGVKDLTKINPGTKLVDLGMDSLIGMEVKQTLERDYDIPLTPKEIRSLTFGDLLAVNAGTFSKGSGVDAKSQEPGTSQVTVPTTLWPEQTMVRLSSSPVSNKSPKLFFIHGVEGHARPFEALANQLNVDSYGLQLSDKISTTSIPEVAAQYIQAIKSVDPDGPYNICGYSSGGTIAFEIASRLEQVFENEVSNLIILDGCLDWNLNRMDERGLYNQWMAQFFTDPRQLAPFSKKLSAAKSSQEFYSIVLDSVKLALPNAKHDEVTKYMNRLKDFIYLIVKHEHESNYKFGGNAVLVKALEKSVYLSSIQDSTYNMKEHCNGQLSTHTVSGNHQSFLSPSKVEETARILNNIWRPAEKNEEKVHQTI